MTKLINDNLRILREQNALKQKDIANILNITQPNYSRWETSEKTIPLIKLNHLCNYFRINMDYCFGLDKKKVMHNDNILDKKLIGNNLKQLRTKNNLTQKELADILNTTQSTIWAYEQGKTLILTSFIYQLALKYHFSIDEFLNRH